jgi:hypothetical protein
LHGGSDDDQRQLKLQVAMDADLGARLLCQAVPRQYVLFGGLPKTVTSSNAKLQTSDRFNNPSLRVQLGWNSIFR